VRRIDTVAYLLKTRTLKPAKSRCYIQAGLTTRERCFLCGPRDEIEGPINPITNPIPVWRRVRIPPP
jgi:hypothetical protein